MRVGLALLKSFGPYLSERLTAGLDRSALLEGLEAFGDEDGDEPAEHARQEEARASCSPR
jgi:hypothetical protein